MIKSSFHNEVPLKNFSLEELSLIKKHLTNSSRDYMTGEWTNVEYFYIDKIKKTISLPKYYPLNKNNAIIDVSEPGKILKNITFKKSFKYRKGQERDVNMVLNDNHIITLMKPPASGKTIIGTSIIINRKVRSLVLVDQDTLKQQWIEAFKVVGENINYGFLKLNGEKEESYKDVYISTIQSIIAKIRKYGISKVKEFYKEYRIGQVLLDECHVLIGPEKFSQFGHICNSKYILALSATPKEDIYYQYWLSSKIIGDKKYDIFPSIIPLDINLNLEKSKKYIYWNGKFWRDRHANKVFQNSKYLNILTSLAYKSYFNKRNILVMCDYNKYGVEILYKILQGVVGEDVGKYIAGCDREKEASKSIIVSNYKMLQKGVDIPKLDTLIMASEIGDLTALEQTIGRLLRLNKGISKRKLLVYDIKETSLPKTGWKRDKRFHFYYEKKFIII